MSEDLAAAPARADPGPALQARFESIRRGAMAGVPMLNPALEVQAVGFKPWGEHWLGVLVTPWFMNLVLMPRVAAGWQRIPERESRHHVFPAGVFEFIGSQDEVLGDYQACSLFSPMFEFADQDSAVATAQAAIEALFDAGSRGVVEPAAAPAPAAESPDISKRGFLFGGIRSPSPAAAARGDGGG